MENALSRQAFPIGDFSLRQARSLAMILDVCSSLWRSGPPVPDVPVPHGPPMMHTDVMGAVKITDRAWCEVGDEHHTYLVFTGA